MDIHSIIRDLKSRIEPEKNLSLYAEQVASDAAQFSLINLSLHLLGLAEAADEHAFSAEILDQIAGLCQKLLAHEALSSEEMISLRSENTAHMQRLSDDIDLFTLNEYVVNRLEHRFMGEKEPGPDYSDAKMTDEILRFLASKQSEEQNLYIVRIAEQLPIRMTKVRFLEAVVERLTIYRETDRRSFDEVLATIRSSAGLRGAADQALKDVDSVLKFEKLNDLDEARFNSVYHTLADVSARLNAEMDIYQPVQEVLNDLTVLSLTGLPETEDKISEAVSAIIRYSCGLLRGENVMKAEEAYAACEVLEGSPEDLILSYADAAAHEDDLTARFEEELEKESIADAFEKLRKIGLLLSGSAYVSLEKTETSLTVDQDYFLQQAGTLAGELKAALDQSGRQYSRALMARVFSVLVPHFSTQEELETFIFDSLRSCTDGAEKAGTVELLKEAMME